MAHALLSTAATVTCPSLTGISARRASSARVVRAEAPAFAPITASPTTLKVPDVAPLKTSSPPQLATPAEAEAPAPAYPYESLPPTPVFPSHAAMALFLQSYARMLQHVQTAATGRADRGVDRVDHSHDALVSGDSLAAAGATVLERVHLGLGALLHHPQHGVAGGERWCAEEARVERCLAELEKDIECIRSAHERPPRAAALALATIHCVDAARLIRSL
ncbi:hypothetical protein CLOM_g6591 [Closterium sp. NIES-68]|nr:hypothetical protein CLOM_g11877 [Closterium sp. NIES-68]GJP47399.1 hypothetical protein CLOM_g6591 [Closterium sp. NIES-68]GJP69582.1 hypothetical protein CLOP_g580 [Closterium sp. NIES-67]